MNKTADGTNGNQGSQRHQIKVIGQFVRDLSFENFQIQRGEWAPKPAQFLANVNLDAVNRGNGVFESQFRLQLNANETESENSIYCLELEYSGLFQFVGIPEGHLQPLLMVECPRLLFPFVRRIVQTATMDGGFPPFNLEMMDFAAMYQASLQQQRAKAEQEDESSS